jgi:hypothetical protein
MLTTRIETDLDLQTSKLYFSDDQGTQISLYTYEAGNVTLDARDSDNTITTEEFLGSLPITETFVQNIRLNFPGLKDCPLGDLDVGIRKNGNRWRYIMRLETGLRIMDITLDCDLMEVTTKARDEDGTMTWPQWLMYLQLLNRIKLEILG